MKRDLLRQKEEATSEGEMERGEMRREEVKDMKRTEERKRKRTGG